MRLIVDAIRVGGGDEMIVLRAYQVDGKLYCDLRNPINCDMFFKVPVVSNLGAVIDAPSTPWHKTKIPWEKLPRVIVTYRSSQGQALLTPIITGVVENSASKVVTQSGATSSNSPATGSSSTTTSTSNTNRPQNPGAGDVSMATAKAKVIARGTGAMDLIASEDFVTRAKEILLVAGVEPVKSLAIAEEINAALQPLYDTVNKLVLFANSFPSANSLAVHPAVVAATIVPPFIVTMTCDVTGPTAAGPPATVTVPFDLLPYDGPSSISNPPSTEYDTPNVRASPRN